MVFVRFVVGVLLIDVDIADITVIAVVLIDLVLVFVGMVLLVDSIINHYNR